MLVVVSYKPKPTRSCSAVESNHIRIRYLVLKTKTATKMKTKRRIRPSSAGRRARSGPEATDTCEDQLAL
jgi:hypothetical protein